MTVRRFPPSPTYDEVHGTTPPTGEHRSNGAARQAGQGKPSKATATRFQTINNFVDATMRNLKPTSATVWVVLWRDARNGIARTSQSDIARRSGLSVRQVRRALAELIDSGAIRLVERGNSFQRCSSYEVIGKP